MHRHKLIHITLALQYFSLEQAASFNFIAVSHEMVHAMDIDDDILNQILVVTGDVSGNEYIAHEVADVVLLESCDACIQECLIHCMVSLRYFRLQSLPCQVRLNPRQQIIER